MTFSMFFNKNKKEALKDPYTSRADTDERDYIQIRLLPQISYYSKASRRLQREYYILSILNTVFMSAVPIILMLPDTAVYARYLSASISAIASVFSSVLLIVRAKENWIEYRNASEELKSEFHAFKAGAMDYQELGPQQQFAMFVERCEQIMQTERSGWYSRMKLEPSQEYGVNGTSEETGS